MVERVELIQEHREELGLNTCCRAPGVAKGSWHYCEKRRRVGPDPEEERLKTEVEGIIADHPAYGCSRIPPELETWRMDYNKHRPHSSLRQMPPADYAAGGDFTQGRISLRYSHP